MRKERKDERKRDGDKRRMKQRHGEGQTDRQRTAETE